MVLKYLHSGGKIFISLLILLIVLSFAFWGVEDVFRTGFGGGNAVATVGSSKITAQELSEAVNRQAQQLAQSLGTTPEQLTKTMNLGPQVLDQMIGEKLLTEKAKDLKILISEDLVIKEISESEKFRDEKGNFNRKEFELFLKSIGENEKSFTKALKDGMSVRALLEALMVNPYLPPPLVQRAFIHENEERVLALLRVPQNYQVKLAAPAEADLVNYYEANKQNFSVPETRDISYALITKEQAQKDVKVTDQEIKQAYEEHLADFTVPEQRTLKHMMFATKEEADKAFDALKKGANFDSYAKEKAKQDQSQTDLGRVSRDDLFGGLDKEVFGLKKGELSKPAQSSLGWHIFKVVELHQPATKSFSEVKEVIRKSLMEEKAADALNNLVIRIQDSLAGGNTLEEVAKVMGLKVEGVRNLTSDGNAAGGAEVALPKIPQFLETAFTADSNEGAHLAEAPNGQSYILRVDQVVPQRIRALDEVRALVTEAYQKEARQKALKETAEAAAVRVQKGEGTLEQEAKKLGLAVETTKPITRSNSGYNLKVPAALVSEAFALAKRTDATAPYPTEEGGYVIASLREVIPVPPLVEGKEMESVSKKLKQSVVNEAFVQLGVYLYKDYDVDVNEKALTQMFSKEQ